MKQITEDYVSYEIAVLLKERGFDIPCRQAYFNGSLVDYTLYGFCDGELLDCPSQSLALKWLREVHNIFIDIYLPSHSEYEDTIYHGTYSFDIFNLNTKVYVYCTWSEKEFNSYEEAVEAAILYVLKNLI